MTEASQRIMGFLNCAHEILENEKSGDKIIARWNELTEQGKREGFFPLLILPEDSLAETLESSVKDAGFECTPKGVAAFRESILRKADGVDARAFLATRFAENLETCPDDDSSDNIMGAFKPCPPVKRGQRHLISQDFVEILQKRVGRKFCTLRMKTAVTLSHQKYPYHSKK